MPQKMLIEIDFESILNVAAVLYNLSIQNKRHEQIRIDF